MCVGNWFWKNPFIIVIIFIHSFIKGRNTLVSAHPGGPELVLRDGGGLARDLRTAKVTPIAQPRPLLSAQRSKITLWCVTKLNSSGIKMRPGPAASLTRAFGPLLSQCWIWQRSREVPEVAVPPEGTTISSKRSCGSRACPAPRGLPRSWLPDLSNPGAPSQPVGLQRAF